MQWTGRNFDALVDWVGQLSLVYAATGDSALLLWIDKSSTWGTIEVGSWVIAERDGDGFYPCTNEQFSATYEAVRTA